MARVWKEDEISLLVHLVKENYAFLTETINNKKTRKDVNNKWEEIRMSLAALGLGPTLNLKQVKKKWSDMKLLAKIAVASYKKERNLTGSGSNEAKIPSEMEYLITSFIGTESTDGVSGTGDCDVAAQHEESGNGIALSTEHECTPSTSTSAHVAAETTEDAALKRPRKRSKREVQGDEIIKVERELAVDVGNIKEQLEKIADVQTHMLHEMRVANQLWQQHLQWQSQFWERQDESRQQQINANTYLADSIMAMVRELQDNQQ